MQLRSRRGWLGLMVAGGWVCLLAGCRPAASSPPTTNPAEGRSSHAPLRVAAASDLRVAFERVLAVWRSRPGAVPVEAIYGSSGQLYTQIRQGAPFDLFLSADTTYPQRLIEEGLVVPASEFRYARGLIFLWARADSPLPVETLGLEVLRDPRVQKIAIAHPEHAPYGRAAVAALRHAGLDELVEPRLVRAENVAQAAQFVQSGAADVGILANALVFAPPLQDRGQQWQIPPDSYPPLVQMGVILRRSRQRPAAEQLRALILSEEGQAILRQFGFLPADESP